MPYSTRELVNEFNVSNRTLRHYENEKLVSPTRDGQSRWYSDNDRMRLKIVLGMRELQFSLAEIREVLDQVAGPERDESHASFLLKRFSEKQALLQNQLNKLTQSSSNLAVMIDRVKEQGNELQSNSPADASCALSNYEILLGMLSDTENVSEVTG